MNFDTAFDRLIGHEGKFDDSPDDPGNWTGGAVGAGELRGTNWGISAAAYPHLDIKRLSRVDAKAIYSRDFWDRARCDEIAGAVAYQYFDAAVNHGPGNGVRFLQRAAGVVDDGKVGDITLDAVNRMEVSDLLMRFNAARLRFYAKIKVIRDTRRAGWFNRVADNLDYAAQDN